MSQSVAPYACKHRRCSHLCGGWASGADISSRYGVSVCADCGEFHVFMEKNGQTMQVNFTLNTLEALAAARRYYDYLSEDTACAEDAGDPQREQLEGFNTTAF